MKKTFFLIISAVVVAFSSCSSEDDIDSFDSPELRAAIATGDRVEFIYNGKTYLSTVSQVGNGSLVFDNKQVEELYKRLQSLPSLVTYYTPENGKIVFFDNMDKMKQYEASQPAVRNSSSSAIKKREFTLYGLCFR